MIKEIPEDFAVPSVARSVIIAGGTPPQEDAPMADHGTQTDLRQETRSPLEKRLKPSSKRRT